MWLGLVGDKFPAPDNLSDDEVAQLFTPALTAVSPPRAGVGEAAVRLLVQRIEDPERPVHRVQLNPSLIVRASTAAPGRPADDPR